MQESLAPEHGREVLSNTLEHFLNGRGISSECDSHLQPFRWNIADACLYIVGNPLDEIGTVFVLHVQHLLINFFCRHATTEQCCGSEVTAVAWVSCAHHIFGIEHLLSQLRNRESTILL